MLGYIIVVTFFAIVITGWIIFCIFKYKKWKRRFINCTREISVMVVEVLEKKTHKGLVADMLCCMGFSCKNLRDLV